MTDRHFRWSTCDERLNRRDFFRFSAKTNPTDPLSLCVNQQAAMAVTTVSARSVLVQGDVTNRDLLLPATVDLIVTSPPYNVGIPYNVHQDTLSYSDYLAFSQCWLSNCFVWAKPQGRLVLNIPLDKNKGGQHSVGADLTVLAQQTGWRYHATIIWNEGNISRRTAWGSWLSAAAPYVIAPVELVVVLYKDSWKKTTGSQQSTLTKTEFLTWTNGLWQFNGERKEKGGHPAPFPSELPRRAINLFSFVHDVVLDPFAGSGTTLLASEMSHRYGIGVDIDADYCAMAQSRLLSMVDETGGVKQGN